MSARKTGRTICVASSVVAGLALWLGCVRRQTEPVSEKTTAAGRMSEVDLTRIEESLLGRGQILLGSVKKHSQRATNHEYIHFMHRMEACLSDGRKLRLDDQKRRSPRDIQRRFYEELFAFGYYLELTISREEPLSGDQNLASGVQILRANLTLYQRHCGPFEYSK